MNYEDLSKEIQLKIAEMNEHVNTTVHYKSPNELRLALLPDWRADLIQGEVEVLKPRFVYFRLVRQNGDLGRYVFDRIEGKSDG